MDEELIQFLDNHNLSELKSSFLKHKVLNIKALQVITDQQYETMGLAIGQVALLKLGLIGHDKDKDKEPADARAQKIREIVEGIKNEKKSKRKIPSNSNVLKEKISTGTKPSKPSKPFKVHIGWLHMASDSDRYKQVRYKEGGGIREIIFNDAEEVTIPSLIIRGQKLFFPGGISKYGPLDCMNSQLGSFSQQAILKFTDIDGNDCNFSTYLKSHGLYASRNYVYLMTWQEYCFDDKTKDEEKQMDQSQEACESLPVTPLTDAANESPSSSDGIAVQNEVNKVIYVVYKSGKPLCSRKEIDDHHLMISYKRTTVSSYSEVFTTISCNNRSQCLESSCFMDTTLLDTDINNYDPLDEGFRITGIQINDKCFLEEARTEDFNNQPFLYPNFPTKHHDKVILHQPSEIWGYDGKQLIIGVVTSKHNDESLTYTWLQDGVSIKSGKGISCIAPESSGIYSCLVVQVNEAGSHMSESVRVGEMTDIDVDKLP